MTIALYMFINVLYQIIPPCSVNSCLVFGERMLKNEYEPQLISVTDSKKLQNKSHQSIPFSMKPYPHCYSTGWFQERIRA